MAPIVFTSHFRVRGGTFESFATLQRDVAARLEAEKPRTLALLVFTDEERATVTIVHVFGDAESMDLHVEGAAERSRAAYEFLIPAGWEIFGTPSDAVVAMLREAAATASVPLTLRPTFIGGFLRMPH